MSFSNSETLRELLDDVKMTKNKLAHEISKLEEIYEQIIKEKKSDTLQALPSTKKSSIDSLALDNNDNPFNLYLYMNIDEVIFEKRGYHLNIRPAFFDLLSWVSNYFYCTIITDNPGLLSEYMIKSKNDLNSEVTILNYGDYNNLEEAVDPYNDFYLIHSQEDLDSELTELYDDSYKDRCIQLEKKPIEDIQSDLYEIIESKFKKLKSKTDGKRTDKFSSYMSLSTPTNWTYDKEIKGKKKIELKISNADKFSFEYIWKISNEVTGFSKVIKHSKTLTQLIEDLTTLPELLKQLEVSVEGFKTKK